MLSVLSAKSAQKFRIKIQKNNDFVVSVIFIVFFLFRFRSFKIDTKSITD